MDSLVFISFYFLPPYDIFCKPNLSKPSIVKYQGFFRVITINIREERLFSLFVLAEYRNKTETRIIKLEKG